MLNRLRSARRRKPRRAPRSPSTSTSASSGGACSRAPFDGKLIRELGLPPGCILVRVREHGCEWVPTAQTRLEAHMRITAVIAPEATARLALLRAGCDEGEHTNLAIVPAATAGEEGENMS
jgi:hypothetical protein